MFFFFFVFLFFCFVLFCLNPPFFQVVNVGISVILRHLYLVKLNLKDCVFANLLYTLVQELLI